MTGVCPAGFPHSDTPGSQPASGSPRLFAASHVLHRRLVPRHPPCALPSLTAVFRVRSFAPFGARQALLRASCLARVCVPSAYAVVKDPSRPNRPFPRRPGSLKTPFSPPSPPLRSLPPLLSFTPPRSLATGGGERIRTDDLRLAKPALSQLSYAPTTQSPGGPR